MHLLLVAMHLLLVYKDLCGTFGFQPPTRSPASAGGAAGAPRAERLPTGADPSLPGWRTAALHRGQVFPAVRTAHRWSEGLLLYGVVKKCQEGASVLLFISQAELAGVPEQFKKRFTGPLQRWPLGNH